MKILRITIESSLILSLSAMALIQSCVEHSFLIPVTRVIVNETEIEAQIAVYGSGVLQESIVILEKRADTLISSCAGERGHVVDCPPVWGMGYEFDSVRVVFDDKIYISYCKPKENEGCSVNDKNIMFFNVQGGDQRTGYEEVEDQVFVFTLTQADLDVAIPLEN